MKYVTDDDDDTHEERIPQPIYYVDEYIIHDDALALYTKHRRYIYMYMHMYIYIYISLCVL